MANDFGLSSKKSRFLKRKDLDRIFIAADTVHTEVHASSKDVAAQLSRLQFYCALIRVAIAKYVCTHTHMHIRTCARMHSCTGTRFRSPSRCV